MNDDENVYLKGIGITVLIVISAIIAYVTMPERKPSKPIKIEAEKVGEAVGKTSGRFSKGFIRGFKEGKGNDDQN